MFTSMRAEDLAQRYNDVSVRPYFAEVVEIYPAAQIVSEIRQEEAHYE